MLCVRCLLRIRWPLVIGATCAMLLSTGCFTRRTPVGQANLTDAMASNDGHTQPLTEPTDSGWAHANRELAADDLVDTEPAPSAVEESQGIWDQLLEQARQSIQSDRIDEARNNIARLEEFDVEPTPAQSDRLADIRVILENHAETKELRAALKMLAAENRDDVLAAQEQLFAQPAAALPLLKEAARADQPAAVKGTLEMLRRLQQPGVTLPIMVGVLERPEQEASWPDAVREILATAAPGAGGPLLNLAVTSELPRQRMAALDALANVSDPPPETLAALLPMIHGDGPELAAALQAANHALNTHRQHDLLTGRGWETDLTPDQQDLLAALPDRLSAIIGSSVPGELDEPAQSARKLAIAVRHVAAEPIAGIQIVAYGGALDDSRVATVLDGQWNTVDPKLMWRHPLSDHGSLVLDLGRQRTVTGVRFWNLNEANASHRGWKDVSISVGETADALAEPVAVGILPEAPGAADQPDFSTTIPVPFVRGRYVRLRSESAWRADGYAGLTEVQVLGF